MSVTDTFGKLKAQVEEADRTVRTAAEQNQAEIEQKVNDARREADERAAELRTKGQEAATESKSHWQEMQADLDATCRMCVGAWMLGRQQSTPTWPRMTRTGPRPTRPTRSPLR